MKAPLPFEQRGRQGPGALVQPFQFPVLRFTQRALQVPPRRQMAQHLAQLFGAPVLL